ncbi:unnamed protein product [Gongylonema pulchrum]|uniref:Ras-GAP domain-containing protein n=1 Tax=Gongylonema pulchrum TaxID=637853 RepID=A0A183DZW3_9BILA|nr:unnamed protein product [Gongylonema pulchrum]
MTCFPQSLGCIVRRLYTVLVDQKKLSHEQATLTCTDLIFTYLICPAIANPETLGVISDTPVTYIARCFIMKSMPRVVQCVLTSHGDSVDSLFAVSTESPPQIAAVRTSTTGRRSDEQQHKALNAILRRLPVRVVRSEVAGLTATIDRTAEKNQAKERNIVRSATEIAQSGDYKVLRSKQFKSADSPETHTSLAISSEVLVFPLGENRVPLGMCPEEKFMESVRHPQRLRKHKISDGSAEKRTRFMDTESIGNADGIDDDVEDVSTLPDNFSDVVPISANVSGRGSPSVSDAASTNHGGSRSAHSGAPIGIKS